MTTRIDIHEFKKNFPRQQGKICFNHCRISPLYRLAAEREAECAKRWADEGIDAFFGLRHEVPALHTAAAQFIGTEAGNISFTRSCAEGINLIAQGFRFQNEDEVVSYVFEFPSNHHPWRSAERFRSIDLKLLPNVNPLSSKFDGLPCAWSMDDLDSLVSSKTRIIAVSHVQFTSGFAADLHALGSYCRDRGIFLVVDAAQSLGCIPIDVKQMNISALVSSGWKWLLGPYGGSLLFTTPEFREHVNLIFPGPASMKPKASYLDLDWDPLETGGKFEYSAVPLSLTAALRVCFSDIFVPLGRDAIWKEVCRLQSLLFDELKGVPAERAAFPEAHRSGICSFLTEKAPATVVAELGKRNVVVSERDGYVRLAPHFYNTDEEVRFVAGAFAEVLSE